MAFRYFVGLAGEKVLFHSHDKTQPTVWAASIHIVAWAHGRQGESYEISLPVPWQLGQELTGRMWVIGNSNISLCDFTADSFIWTSAQCPVHKQWPPGGALPHPTRSSASCLEGKVYWSFKDTGKESWPSEPLDALGLHPALEENQCTVSTAL